MPARCLFFSFLLTSSILVAQDAALKVITYNIKYDNEKDTVNNWDDRKDGMVKLLKEQQASFIGMQEVLVHQLNYLTEELTNYEYLGVGREDGKQKGEFTPILFNTEDFRLLNSNTFWLSKTPEKISIGWDAALERICTYGLFENIVTGERLWVFNTHFDHVGVKARKKSVRLLVKKIRDLNLERLPVILMGDLNLTPAEKPIQWLARKMDDALTISQNKLKGPKGTFNGFDIKKPMTRRIDYIFLEGFEVARYLHLDERLENGKHISDHLPVEAIITR